MNTFEIEILDDGRIKVTTEGFTSVVHKNADEFLKLLNSAFGSPVDVQKNKKRKVSVLVGRKVNV